MRRNLAPLIIIALLVAVVATALFYGLVLSRLGGVEASTVQAATTTGAESSRRAPTITTGMRAITVHVSDSTGLLNMLSPGQRVDVQALLNRPGGEAELRTIVQNVQLLSINSQPEVTPGRPALPIAALLVRPDQADVVALVDSAARIRLSLRSSADAEVRGRSVVRLSEIMRDAPDPPVPATLVPRTAAVIRPVTERKPSESKPQALRLTTEGRACTRP